MIYLDVTGGCTLALQSGIPRTTREIHRLARERLREVMPIRWQPFRRTYTRLSSRAAALLENRPLENTGARRAPRDTTGPLLRAAFCDLASWPEMVPLHRTLRAADTLLLTSLFPDNRLGYLEKLLAAPGRKIALFHDARPAFTPPPTSSKNVLYVSRLKQVKNHPALLAACEMLWREGHDFSLTLIGCEDEPRESEEVKRGIKQLQIDGRKITWHAQVSEDELHAAYRNASFTVFPSRREGFGLPILESFWHGRGVICSGGDAMGEVSRGPGALHVDVSQPAAIAAAMRALLDDDAACLALAQEAHARSLRSWDDYWRELEPCLAA